MISIRHIEYELKENPELAFTRLAWAVEEIDSLSTELMSNIPVSTRRPWVGTLEKDVLKFAIIEPRGLFSIKFFQVVVRGKIHQVEDGSRLEIKMRLGFNTIVMFLLACAMTIMLIFAAIISAEWGNILVVLGWMIVPVLLIILLNRKLDKIDGKVRELFGVIE